MPEKTKSMIATMRPHRAGANYGCAARRLRTPQPLQSGRTRDAFARDQRFDPPRGLEEFRDFQAPSFRAVLRHIGHNSRIFPEESVATLVAAVSDGRHVFHRTGAPPVQVATTICRFPSSSGVQSCPAVLGTSAGCASRESPPAITPLAVRAAGTQR